MSFGRVCQIDFERQIFCLLYYSWYLELEGGEVLLGMLKKFRRNVDF